MLKSILEKISRTIIGGQRTVVACVWVVTEQDYFQYKVLPNNENNGFKALKKHDQAEP